jgi:hypothetical protein
MCTDAEFSLSPSFKQICCVFACAADANATNTIAPRTIKVFIDLLLVDRQTVSLDADNDVGDISMFNYDCITKHLVVFADMLINPRPSFVS